jgi:hypothetical protein
VSADRSVTSLLHLVEASLEIGLRYLADRCEDAQDIEEAGGVVTALQWANGVCFRESGSDSRRNQGGWEERVGGSVRGAVHGCGVWLVVSYLAGQRLDSSDSCYEEKQKERCQWLSLLLYYICSSTRGNLLKIDGAVCLAILLSTTQVCAWCSWRPDPDL